MSGGKKGEEKREERRKEEDRGTKFAYSLHHDIFYSHESNECTSLFLCKENKKF